MADAPKARSIFRDAALERLSTPEQLDRLIEVTSPRAWIALAVTLLLLAAFTLWGFAGTVVTRVEGQGMLLGGDVYDVVPVAGGQVIRIAVGVGETLAANAVIAEVDQPALRQQVENGRARVADLRAEHERLRAFGSQDVSMQQSLRETRRRNLEQTLAAARARRDQLETQVGTEKELAGRGLVTKPQLRTTEQQLEAAREDVRRARADLQAIASEDLSGRFTQEQQLNASTQRIAEAQRALVELERDFAARTQVLASRAGTVLAVMAAAGDLLAPGVPIAKLDLSASRGERLQAIVYVGMEDGKKVAEGMEIRIAPASIKPEEHGYILGRVTRVSVFPATTASMMHVLKNDRLVQQLMQQGAPFEVRAELLPDATAASGYRWTSAGGPAARIGSGTPCAARIAVRTQRPAELVVPAIRHALSLY